MSIFRRNKDADRAAADEPLEAAAAPDAADEVEAPTVEVSGPF